MVSRFALINQIVADHQHFSCREMQIPKAPTRTVMIPLNLDPPENMPYRKLLMPRFSAKAINEMKPRLTEIAVELVEGVADTGECNFSYEIAARYPVSVFMEMMGLPKDRLREFRSLVEAYFSAIDADAMQETDSAITTLLTELIAYRRRVPSDDLISHLLASQIDGRALSEAELLSICVLLFTGGMDTVTNMLGFAFQYLAQDAALQERLAANPERIADFTEEAIRMFAIVSTPRVVAKDCERFGVSFRAGEMVSCVLSLAGRDESVNERPNEFDIDRDRKTHLTFSTGPHLCLGHILARAEITCLTTEWLKRVPRFELGEGEHSFRPGNVNSLMSLPLRWMR